MKRKIFTLLAIALLTMIVLSTKVFAAESFLVNAKASADTLNPGDTLTVSVSVSDIDVEKGLGTLGGTLGYDKTVFEEVKAKNLKSGEDWESVTYNADNGKFVTLTSSGETLKTDTEVFTITLKVLDTAKEGKTTIKLSDLNSSDGEKDLYTADTEKIITIASSTSKPEDNTTDNNTTNNTSGNNTTSNNNTTNNATGNNNTTSNTITNTTTNTTNTSKASASKNNTITILPYAGESDIAIMVGMLVISTVIGYFKLKSYKEVK